MYTNFTNNKKAISGNYKHVKKVHSTNEHIIFIIIPFVHKLFTSHGSNSFGTGLGSKVNSLATAS